jgi:exosortase/archaeosortase family protein
VLPARRLATLALPVVSSLQFYAGYPLRVVTRRGEPLAARRGGLRRAREGSAMLVDGRLVIVDAPCSGVQMVWMAWFCACAVAAWRGLPDRVFAKRLAFVGAIVLAGNIVRNTLLVGLEARGSAAAPWQHEAIGMVVLGLVCAAVAALVASARQPGAAPIDRVPAAERRSRRHAARRAGSVARGLRTRAAGVAARSWRPAPVPLPEEWPREWNGRPLRPLALGSGRGALRAQFPGRIERLTDEESVLVWREVRTPTRMLHPATDCYRGLGYRVAEARLERDPEARPLALLRRRARTGRRGSASASGSRTRSGLAFTDASSWFWAAQLGRSTGPWRAITVATPARDRLTSIAGDPQRRSPAGDRSPVLRRPRRSALVPGRAARDRARPAAALLSRPRSTRCAPRPANGRCGPASGRCR